MNVQRAMFADAAQVLRRDALVGTAVDQLTGLLRDLDAPRLRKSKSKPEYIYDHRALQATIRWELAEKGWSVGDELTAATVLGAVRLTGTRADLVSPGLHVILEFGNRASWAHNLVTRVLAGVNIGSARLTCMVTPTDEFSRRIDSNLGTFERICAEMSYVADQRPSILPGPMLIVGVEPESMPPDLTARRGRRGAAALGSPAASA